MMDRRAKISVAAIMFLLMVYGPVLHWLGNQTGYQRGKRDADRWWQGRPPASWAVWHKTGPGKYTHVGSGLVGSGMPPVPTTCVPADPPANSSPGRRDYWCYPTNPADVQPVYRDKVEDMPK